MGKIDRWLVFAIYCPCKRLKLDFNGCDLRLKLKRRSRKLVLLRRPILVTKYCFPWLPLHTLNTVDAVHLVYIYIINTKVSLFVCYLSSLNNWTDHPEALHTHCQKRTYGWTENNNNVLRIIDGATCLSNQDWIILFQARVQTELIIKF